MADRNGTNAGRSTLAGAYLFLGATTFWIVNTIAESRYAGFSVRDDTLSRLGALDAPTQWLWNAGLIALGLGWIIGMTLLHQGRGRVGRLAFHLVPGVATLVVAMFPSGSVSSVHTAAALVTFVGGGLVALADSRLVRPPFRYASAGLGAITLLSIVAAPVLVPILGDGGTERLVAYPMLIWTVSFGAYAMAGGLDRNDA